VVRGRIIAAADLLMLHASSTGIDNRPLHVNTLAARQAKP
jgi:hypothetical protein